MLRTASAGWAASSCPSFAGDLSNEYFELVDKLETHPVIRRVVDGDNGHCILAVHHERL
jgi:hypothetical protein